MEGLDLKQMSAMVSVIAEEKGLPEDTVLDVVQMAIAAAWRKDNGDKDMNVRALLDTKTGKATVYISREVIEDDVAYNPATEIPLKEARELKTDAEIGDTVEGTVKNVTDFGAFIDLGGCDGLLHISEMSWGRVENPKKVFKVGDVVKVLIKDISGTKIALSLKFEDQNPWRDAASKYAVGTEVTGKVARMTDFGAFIELEPGIDALLHVSQISKEHIDKPSDVLKSGEEVTAKVVDFNEADKKISLSIKAMFAEPKAEKAADADVVSVDIDAVIAEESGDAAE